MHRRNENWEEGPGPQNYARARFKLPEVIISHPPMLLDHFAQAHGTHINDTSGPRSDRRSEIGYLPPPLTNTGLLGFEYHVNNFGQKRRFKTLWRGRDQGLDSNYMKYRARITSLVIELDSWVGWSLEWSVIDCLTCYPESWVIIVPDQYQVRPHTFSN